MTAPSASDLTAACDALSAADPALARAYAAQGLPVWRQADPVYATIARTIAYQQISVKAAAAIWGRAVAGLGEVTPAIVLTTRDEDWRAYGMSRPKVSHLRSVAEAITSGALDLERCHDVGGDPARKELLAVKGIGPWTAELFLLYAVGDMDAFPTADVGLMEGYRLLCEAETRLTPKEFMQSGERWRPYRGVAAHLLWAALHAARGD